MIFLSPGMIVEWWLNIPVIFDYWLLSFYSKIDDYVPFRLSKTIKIVEIELGYNVAVYPPEEL